VYIDGGMPFEKRATNVERFRTEPLISVLIFSSVGGVGLNLSCANIIIFLVRLTTSHPSVSYSLNICFQDQPWSAQDERQIRGRAHRQPQKKEVKCYHLLAANTADIILSSMAQGKKDMMEAFLSTEVAKGMSISSRYRVSLF